MASIEINKVKKIYKNGVVGIEDLSVKIPRGRVTLLIGENGAGKSTLINLLGGYIFPTEGEILYNEEQLGKKKFKNIGFCTQDLSIDWYLDVYHNVMMGALLAGYSLNESRKKTDDMLRLIKLSEYKHQGVETLSGGQQQRVQVARALVHNPAYIVLDEPIVGLDAQSSISLLSYLRELAHNQKKTVIISSHQFSVLEKYSDDILLLIGGKLLKYDNISNFKKPFEKYAKYEIEYKGVLAKKDLDELKKHSYVNNGKSAVEVVTELTLNEVLSIINKDIVIGNIKSSDLDLQDIYLFLNYIEGGDKYGKY